MGQPGGIAIMVMSMALFASKDGFAKVVLQDLTPAQIIWTQYTFTFVVLALVTAPRHGWRSFLPTPVGLQLFRGLVSVGGVGSIYWALSYIPLADAAAMFLVAPLVVTALSPLLLGERVGLRRALAVAAGFVGVLLVLEPGFGADIKGYLIGLLAGLLIGFSYIGNRRLTSAHPQLVNVAHSVLIGAVVLLPVMPFVWVTPPESQYANLSAFLLIALFAQSLMVVAFRYAPASVIAPYQYTVMVFATAIGYFAFGTFPGPLTWAGIAMIVGAGIFIARRERRLAAGQT